ncbi:MAG TPA: DinB family protein [Candidatus Angelobacter sp.]|nr:DinB family protein [Candidatus Angelobacter sp.]
MTVMTGMNSCEEWISYIERVYQRTRRIAVLIPANELEHNFGAHRFTPGDLVRHLAAINRYMFIETAAGRLNRYPGHQQALAQGLEAVLAYHQKLHEENMEILRSFTPARLEEKCETPDGTRITVWKWLRAMTEHEAHHRGQLYWMLSELGVRTPPLYGLTSEEVHSRGQSQQKATS